MSVEILEWVNRRTVSRAWELACVAQARNSAPFAAKGMRAARARDATLLLVLERGAGVLEKWSREREEERIRLRPDAPRIDATEFSMWRAAYESADRGDPMPQMMWVYGAAAHLAGY
jgi:hypothetical protein